MFCLIRRDVLDETSRRVWQNDLTIWAKNHDVLEFNPLDVCNDKKGHRIKYKEGEIYSEKIYIRGSYGE